MIDDQTPGENNSFEPLKPQLQGHAGGNGDGNGGRSTRVKTGDGRDDELFQRIMRALRKIERETGNVPTLGELSAATGVSLQQVRTILLEYLPSEIVEGSTEFRSSLRQILLGIDQFLVENGIISPEQWSTVMRERGRTGEPISLILSRLGLVSESQVKNALELQYGVNYLPLSKMPTPAENCLALLPVDVMRQHQLVPVSRKDSRVTIAMVNPNNLVALDDIKVRLKGMQVKLVVCTEVDFSLFTEPIFSGILNMEDSDIEDEDRNGMEQQFDRSLDDTQVDVYGDIAGRYTQVHSSSAVIIQLVNQILAKAIRGNISSIHIEPDEQDVSVLHFSNGALKLDRKLPKAILPGLVSRVKIMANLDLGESGLPQHGSICVRLRDQDININVSVEPAGFGERIVIHILQKGQFENTGENSW